MRSCRRIAGLAGCSSAATPVASVSARSRWSGCGPSATACSRSPGPSTARRRVLRPGGRISLYELINVLMFPEPHGRFWGYEVTRAADLAARVSAAFAAGARPAMVGFDDRDLLAHVEAAGFARIHVETHADIEPYAVSDLDALLGAAPNPNAPTVREVIESELDAGEQRRLLDALGDAVAAGPGIRRTVGAYVAARA